MKPLRGRQGPLERDIVDSMREALIRAGWTIVDKTHGNCFQPGWPDLYCFHPTRGHRWVEAKRPVKGRLTKAQRARFACWTAAGEGVWILESTDLAPLFREANWTDWLSGPQRAHYEDRKAVLAPDGPRWTDWEDWM